MKFFAVCPRGLEGPMARELEDLAKRPKIKAWGEWLIDTPCGPSGGVSFAAPMAAVLAINLYSRIASRVLMQMCDAPYRKEDDIYKAVRSLAWEDWFDPTQTLRVDLTAHRSPLTSLNFATLRIKDAICDRMREVKGERPSVDTELPDVRVSAHLTATHLTVYLDTSGQALFKRGWREEKGAAPLKENLAAGILALTSWTKEKPLIDPMCGSGTFLIEAAYLALGIPSGAIRAGLIKTREEKKPEMSEVVERQELAATTDKPKYTRYRPTRVDIVRDDQGFGFQRLKPFQTQEMQNQWQDLLGTAKQEIEQGLARVDDLQLAGSDIDQRMIEVAKSNWVRAGLSSQAKVLKQVRQLDASGVKSAFDRPGVMLFNPPYGERIEMKGRGAREALPKNINSPELMEFLQHFGVHLKDYFSGWQVFVLTTDTGLPGQLRMKESKRTPVYNGALECRLFCFDIRPSATEISRD